MNRRSHIVAALLISMCVCSLLLAAPQKVAAKIEKDQVVVNVDGKLFTCYKFVDSQKYPYFWPVNGPLSGKSITTETSDPYPHHHSLFFGCDRVNGGNYCRTSIHEARFYHRARRLPKRRAKESSLPISACGSSPAKSLLSRTTGR